MTRENNNLITVTVIINNYRKTIITYKTVTNKLEIRVVYWDVKESKTYSAIRYHF